MSSLRADHLDHELLRLLARGGYRTLTTAADGASQRLRDQVDRHTQTEDLLRAARLSREHGMALLKLYVLIGLPLGVQKAIAEILPQIRGDSQLESGCLNGQRGDQCFRSRFSSSSR